MHISIVYVLTDPALLENTSNRKTTPIHVYVRLARWRTSASSTQRKMGSDFGPLLHKHTNTHTRTQLPKYKAISLSFYPASYASQMKNERTVTRRFLFYGRKVPPRFALNTHESWAAPCRVCTSPRLQAPLCAQSGSSKRYAHVFQIIINNHI